jgi:hypothetical protein
MFNVPMAIPALAHSMKHIIFFSLITSKLQQGIFKMLFYKSGIEEI